MKPPAIYTIGHGAASLQLFRSLLEKAGITLVIDCRSRPYSRWQYQFNREELAEDLHRWGIEYQWKGANLGGLDENTAFQETVADVAELARTRAVALLCSEKSPEQCHRRLLLAPAFQAHGFAVIHLLHDGTSTTEPEPPATLF